MEGLISNIPEVTLSDQTEIRTSKVHALKLNHLATIPNGLHSTVRKARCFSPFHPLYFQHLAHAQQQELKYLLNESKVRLNSLTYSQICIEVFKKLRAHRQQQPQCLTLHCQNFENCIPRNGVSNINPASLPMFLSSLSSIVRGEEGQKQKLSMYWSIFAK